VNLDRIPHTHVSIAGRRHGAFHVCGWSGFWLAVALTCSLCEARGLSVWVQVAVAAAAAAVYFSMARLARRIFGRPALIYYHHILGFLAVAAALTAVLRAPVLAHLDVTACGLALFTAVARVGCLMVGCCHGQPARSGIAYGPEHRRYGVPGYLTGVRLIPVQAIEAAGCGLLAVAGSVTVLAGAPRGTALVVFLDGYAVLRFGLEWVRGDLARPYLHHLSEAQWTSLALTIGVAGGAAVGTLAGGGVATIPAVLLLGAALATNLGRFPGCRELLAPTHVSELARGLSRLELSRPDRIITTMTSRGLRVSIGETAEHAHYTLSTGGSLGQDGYRRLARLVLWICRNDSEAELIPGDGGAVHVVASRVEHRSEFSRP
jgi:hypothetical protein